MQAAAVQGFELSDFFTTVRKRQLVCRETNFAAIGLAVIVQAGTDAARTLINLGINGVQVLRKAFGERRCPGRAIINDGPH